MPTSIRIPKALLEEVDRKARALQISRSRFIAQALKRELSAPADWSPGFFDQLSKVDTETATAVNDLLTSIRQARIKNRQG